MTTSSTSILSTTVHEDGIAIVTIDMVKHPVNLMDNDFLAAYLHEVQVLLSAQEVKGIVVTSAKKGFMVGADLKAFLNPTLGQAEMLDYLLQVHQQFRRIERAGKPLVAAINGDALGGGLELALTCHYRVAANHPGIKIGLPETQLGLLPGGGGTSRLPRLIGLPKGIPLVVGATLLSPAKAMALGLVDELVDSPDQLIAAAKALMGSSRRPQQPWDAPTYRIPDGGLFSSVGMQTMAGAIGNLRKHTHGLYPSKTFALGVIHDGIELPLDRQLEIEARYFVKALYSKEAQNMIRTGYFAVRNAKKGAARPAAYPPSTFHKIGIIGAGMMGAGIASVASQAGLSVVVKDMTLATAQRALTHTESVGRQLVAQRKMTEGQLAAQLGLVQVTDTAADFADCDVVIEAVFEDTELKGRVTRDIEPLMELPNAIFASNTSTIPISTLAQAASRPGHFIGIHFFSPVEKMPLVEIIIGKQTSTQAIAAAVDFAVRIGKVPITVHDKRGFFTTRIFNTYTREGALLLEEGVPAAVIENVAKTKGMPVGPLAVTDEVSLILALEIMDGAPDLSASDKRAYQLYQKMVAQLGRGGRKVGKGFYDYPEQGPKVIWPGLKDVFTENGQAIDEQTIAKRLLHIMALESYRCLDEGVLQQAQDGDVGAMLGLGFPAYTGGVLSYIDYIGLAEFIADCDSFAVRFGDRWDVPTSLRDKLKVVRLGTKG